MSTVMRHEKRTIGRLKNRLDFIFLISHQSVGDTVALLLWDRGAVILEGTWLTVRMICRGCWFVRASPPFWSITGPTQALDHTLWQGW
jgi:hypothetical protein